MCSKRTFYCLHFWFWHLTTELRVWWISKKIWKVISQNIVSDFTKKCPLLFRQAVTHLRHFFRILLSYYQIVVLVFFHQLTTKTVTKKSTRRSNCWKLNNLKKWKIWSNFSGFSWSDFLGFSSNTLTNFRPILTIFDFLSF